MTRADTCLHYGQHPRDPEPRQAEGLWVHEQRQQHELLQHQESGHRGEAIIHLRP